MSSRMVIFVENGEITYLFNNYNDNPQIRVSRRAGIKLRQRIGDVLIHHLEQSKPHTNVPNLACRLLETF